MHRRRGREGGAVRNTTDQGVETYVHTLLEKLGLVLAEELLRGKLGLLPERGHVPTITLHGNVLV